MTDIQVKEAEVVQETGLVRFDAAKMLKDIDRPVYEAMSNVQSLDWKNLPPNLMALVLMQKQYPVSGGGFTTLNFRQAMIFALRCYELGLSPLSSEVFYNSATGQVNVTLEGRRALARSRNIDLGPPIFEEVSRSWESIPRITQAAEEAKKLGFNADAGITCKMRIGPIANNEHVSYTAYLSEWFVPKSSVWREKPLWMLSVRAQDKCLAMALGSGVSDQLSE